MSKNILIDALELSVAERLQLVQDLWDSISELPDPLKLSEAENAELKRRFEDYKRDPSSSLSWEELKVRMGL